MRITKLQNGSAVQRSLHTAMRSRTEATYLRGTLDAAELGGTWEINEPQGSVGPRVCGLL